MELSLGLIHMKLGRETLIKQRFMGVFCTCALHHRRQKINGNFYLEVMVFSRHSTSSLRIFSISSKSVFVSGNTDFKR